MECGELLAAVFKYHRESYNFITLGKLKIIERHTVYTAAFPKRDLVIREYYSVLRNSLECRLEIKDGQRCV